MRIYYDIGIGRSSVTSDTKTTFFQPKKWYQYTSTSILKYVIFRVANFFHEGVNEFWFWLDFE